MTDNKSSYKSIFKATSLFGGVEIYQILILVIKSKIIAVLLGTVGVGILGLFQSAQLLVKQITSVGLSQSAVRDVAEVYSAGNSNNINRTLAVLRILVWITGIIGFVIFFIVSPVLSDITFGNYSYTLSFALLSITLLFDQLCAGRIVILQGFRHLREMAKVTVYGATLGLLFSIPIYYYWGINGIVPTLIIHSFALLFVAYYFTRGIGNTNLKLPHKIVFSQGANMLKMGMAMTISGVITALISYIIRWYIRVEGGLEEVGLYQAGFAIINVYVGMIFTAIGKDYYPRLSAINNDNLKCKELVSQQGEIAILIMAPMLMACLLLMPYLILLLYSEKFVPANEFIEWACLGMMFRLLSWLISYQLVAKAESRLFVINEIISGLYSIVLYLLGYYWGGLKGLGITFLIGYFIYFVQLYFVVHKKYNFVFSSEFIKIFLIETLLVFITLLIVSYSRSFIFIAVIVSLIGFLYSLYNLNKRICLLRIKSKK